MSDRERQPRAISPVVGIVLLVAIALLLSAATAGFVLNLADRPDPAPEVDLVLETDADEPGAAWLRHRHGDRLDGDRVRLRGVADADGLAGQAVVAGEREEVVPTDTTVQVVWYGDDDRSYVVAEFEVDPATVVPEPDVGCAWVDSETNGGTDDITVDDRVVNCNVETDRVIELRNGGVIIGDASSDAKLLDVDGGEVLGDVAVEKDVNLQDGTVAGSVTARTEGVKLGSSTVEGGVSAEKQVDVNPDSRVGGDVVSHDRGVDVQDGSVGGTVDAAGQVSVDDGSVDGSIASDDAVSLDGATVEGEVYAAASDFSCTDSTINGQDCDDYTPADPDDG